MKVLHLAWLFCALPLLAGCQTTYTQLQVTNPRGELLANWIALGPVSRVETGYRITALERTDGEPHPTTTRYPDGWRTTVVGPYIHRSPCARPAWLGADGK